MSLQYFGWNVIYDEGSPGEELGAYQCPRDRGIYTMYHGTSVPNARLIIANGFKPSEGGMLGKGVYVSRDIAKAGRYPLKWPDGDRVVLKLRVRVGRVKRIDRDDHPMQYTWSSLGYDTAWVPPKCGMKAVPSGLQEDCVFNPKDVKVVGIAKAPDHVLQELQELVQVYLNPNPENAGAGAGPMCPICKRKTLRESPHATQQCWGCERTICPFMLNHVCVNNVNA